MRPQSHKTGRLALSMATFALLVLTFAVAAPAALASSPVTWSPAESTYGSSSTSFVAVPAPAPAGTGMTQPPTGMAYGAGFWDPGTEVFAFGFVNAVPTGPGLPTMPETELAATALPAGTTLTLVFDKTAGRRIDFVAVMGDPDALVSLDNAPAASLTAADEFTVRATITDPVASAGGNVGAAFGLIVDCGAAAARDYHGSLFVTNMHWLDVQPPSFTAAGMAGLSASGSNGVAATFDGIFNQGFLMAMGISDANTVQGYVDASAVTGWPGATFDFVGIGDGSLWQLAYFKFRITNSTWSRHDIMYGRQVAPAKPAGLSPKGTISGKRPTFKWRKVGSSASYEVRVYKGSKLLLKKTACTALSWRASKALPRKVRLTWKVRGRNGAGAGTWSSALKFRIK